MHVTPHTSAGWGSEVYVGLVNGENQVVEVLTSKIGTRTDEPFYFSIL